MQTSNSNPSRLTPRAEQDKPLSGENPASYPAAGETSEDADGRDVNSRPHTADRRFTLIPPWLRDPLPWLAFAVALAADQISKAAITSTLLRGPSWPDDGFFRFTYVRNSGTVFGLLQGQQLLLTIVSFVILAGMIYFFRRSPLPSKLMRVAFGMLLAGALGNLIDRLRFGSVVDFVDVGPWPIFNLADSSILIAIGIFIWRSTTQPSSFGGERVSGSDPTGAETEAATGDDGTPHPG